MKTAAAPSRNPVEEAVCLREVHADLSSLGSIILGSVCVLLLVLSGLVAHIPLLTPLEVGGVFALTLVAWLYYVNCVTERLQLYGHEVRLRSCFMSQRTIELNGLQEMLLVYQGLNVERGIMTISFRRKGQSPESLILGPCWHRHKLELFLHSVEEVLHTPKLLEEVR